MGDDAPESVDEAMERFDLQLGMEFGLSPERINEFANRVEQAEAADLDAMSDERIADLVAALKRLEGAAEDARKDHFEDELDDRVDDGARVGPVAKTRGTSRYVTDEEEVLQKIVEAGGNPEDAMDVKASKLEEVANALGIDASDYIGESHYSYFRRVD